MWYKNIACRFFGLVTKHACDRPTDGRTIGQNYDSQDRASIAASRGKKPISSTRPSCWIQISTVDVINIAFDTQKFMTLTGELSWQRLPFQGYGCARQNLDGSRALTAPLSGMPYHPRASNCYRQSTYQIWSLYLHSLRRYETRYKMSKMGWFGVVSITQGHGNSTNR